MSKNFRPRLQDIRNIPYFSIKVMTFENGKCISVVIVPWSVVRKRDNDRLEKLKAKKMTEYEARQEEIKAEDNGDIIQEIRKKEQSYKRDYHILILQYPQLTNITVKSYSDWPTKTGKLVREYKIDNAPFDKIIKQDVIYDYYLNKRSTERYFNENNMTISPKYLIKRNNNQSLFVIEDFEIIDEILG